MFSWRMNNREIKKWLILCLLRNYMVADFFYCLINYFKYEVSISHIYLISQFNFKNVQEFMILLVIAEKKVSALIFTVVAHQNHKFY